MVEEDAVTGMDAVAFAVVDDDPVAVQFRHAVGAAGIEGRRFLLRDFLHLAEELARGGLIKTGLVLQADFLDRVDETERADGIDVGGVLGDLEGDFDVALRAEVVDLVRRGLLDQPVQVARIGQVAVVQEEAFVEQLAVVVEVIDAARVERAGAADDAVYVIAFFQQLLGQIRSVLPGDAGDKRHFLRHALSSASSPDAWQALGFAAAACKRTYY